MQLFQKFHISFYVSFCVSEYFVRVWFLDSRIDGGKIERGENNYSDISKKWVKLAGFYIIDDSLQSMQINHIWLFPLNNLLLAVSSTFSSVSRIHCHSSDLDSLHCDRVLFWTFIVFSLQNRYYQKIEFFEVRKKAGIKTMGHLKKTKVIV